MGERERKREIQREKEWGEFAEIEKEREKVGERRKYRE